MSDVATAPADVTEASLRELVAEANSLIGGGTGRPSPAVQAERAIDKLVGAGSLDELLARSPNPKKVLEPVLEWHRLIPGDLGKAQDRVVTKPVVKAAGAALKQDYSRGLAAIAFASGLAPLPQFDADRIARVITAAADTPVVYAPMRWPVEITSVIGRLLSHYSPDRLEGLVLSLWGNAHERQWWTYTGGLGGPGGRRHRYEQATARAHAALEAATRDGLDTDGFLAQLMRGELDALPEHLQAAAQTTLTPTQADAVGKIARDVYDNPDVGDDTAMLLAALPGLAPDQRPEQPTTRMLDVLDFQAGVSDLAPQAFFPEAPERFEELLPEGDLTPYPIPEDIASLDYATLPGRGTPMVVEFIRNEHELVVNRKFMGNCTGSYHTRLQRGTVVLFKLVTENREVLNAELNQTGAQAQWTLGQVEGRIRAGRGTAVPDGTRARICELFANNGVTVTDTRRR